MEAQRLLWLFFSFSGRIDRRVFGLAGVFLYLIRGYPIYRMWMVSNDETAMAFWFGIFALILGVLLLSHVALCAKRLHDCGYSGWWGLFFLVADIFFFLLLCVPKGVPGPNRYGQRTNSPGARE